MFKIKELKNLLCQLQNITSDEEYIKEVGFQSDWDNTIVEAVDALYNALNKYDERYYIPEEER